MKRSLVVLCLVMAAVAVGAQEMGAGVDLYAGVESEKFNADDRPTVSSVYSVTGVLLLRLDEETEVSPFVGVTLTRERDGDFEADPVLQSQLALQGGAGLYRRVIDGKHLDLLVGPAVTLSTQFPRKTDTFDRWTRVGLSAALWLHLDLALMDGWFFRLGVDTLAVSYEYWRRDERVDTSLVASSQVSRGSVLISLRKWF